MAQTTLNRRLTTLDASFLYAERPGQPMHVGGCMIYEGLVTADELVQTLDQRIHQLPRYRQRAVFPPFGLAHPTWEDDPDFDPRNHVEERALPAPGDDRAMAEAGGQAFAGMLDRNRPLWKLIVFHGRADGNTAVIWKIHHAMVDGVSGVELTMVLHDLTPDAEPPPPPGTPWQPNPLPDPLSLLQDAVRDRLTENAHAWTDDTFRWLRPGDIEQRTRQMTSAVTSSMPAVLQPVPPAPFNGPLSDRRHFAWAPLLFGEVRFIKSALGGTVNDVVLAIIAGGLGRYLRSKGVRTENMALRAMCPVSMRRAEERGALGNLVSMMLAPLFVGILDPVERLRAEREAMERLKEQDQAGGLYSLTELTNRVPPAWQAMVAQWAAPLPNTLLNTVTTNVPGPQIPLYLGGRRLLDWIPLGPLATNIGLFNAILSYDKKLTIGVTVDPALVPDAWFYAECLQESFAELLVAAQRSVPAPAPAPAPVPVEQPAGNGQKPRARSRKKQPAGA